jgi:Zn-finger protein
MDNLTRETIEKHVAVILHDSSFKVRMKTHPELCPCYASGKPCHNISAEDLNCYFCLCPYYARDKEEGGCLINSPKGKWFPNPKKPTGRVWDCSDCEVPHTKSFVERYLRKERGLE